MRIELYDDKGMLLDSVILNILISKKDAYGIMDDVRRLAKGQTSRGIQYGTNNVQNNHF